MLSIPATASYPQLALNPAYVKKCEQLYNSLGLNLSTAINLFLHQSIINNGLPFNASTDKFNAETLAAIEEAEMLLHDPAAPRYSVADALKELKK